MAVFRLPPQAALARLSHRLEALGYPLARLGERGETRALLVDRGRGARAVIVPAALAEEGPDRLPEVVAGLRGLGAPGRTRFLAYGATPDYGARRRLRACGVQLALFEPLDAAVLRFQLNRALTPLGAPARGARRAPLELEVSVRSRLRSYRARVYSLSSRGAFLMTDSPPRVGRRLALRLPAGRLEPRARALVVMSNRRGEARDPTLPAGMAVRFRDLDAPSAALINRLVDERLTQLRV